MNVPIQPNTCACPCAWIQAGEMFSAVRRPLINTSSRREKRARRKQKLGWRPLRDAARDGEVPDAGIATASFRELDYRRGKQATAARIQDRINPLSAWSRTWIAMVLCYFAIHGAGSMLAVRTPETELSLTTKGARTSRVCGGLRQVRRWPVCPCHQGLFKRGIQGN